jgi:hypothetical protein
MGADLYINSLYEANHAKWETLFQQAVARRDALPETSPQRKAAQQEVDRCYQNMLNQGYFRDPYNDWDVLWKFGLSWWTDVIPLLDADHRLSARQTKRLLKLLREREPRFEGSLADLPEHDRRYFRQAYEELQGFLNTAIDLNEPIDCSL